MDASPYYQCCGRGNESEKKVYAADGTVTKFPLYYDNYFVPRGYAFIAADLAGTSRSTGCEDVGGTEEVQGAKAVIDWLNGRAVGRTRERDRGERDGLDQRQGRHDRQVVGRHHRQRGRRHRCGRA